jgi:GTP-binding protein
MHHRTPATAAGSRTAPRQEGSLTRAQFVGSYPTADFRTSPPSPEIAIVGRSNVGKSSLLNALAGRKALARISQTPGKTQTCNVYRVDEAYYIVDLPGYGYARAGKRQRAAFRKLIYDYLGNRRQLEGVVWLLDIRRDPSDDDLAMAEFLAEHARPVLLALTKADKVARSRRSPRVASIAERVGVAEEQCVVTSVQKKEGIGELRDAVAELVRGIG